MPTSSEAEEHLRVIRSLMEKATIYRAISSPAAALGGILSIAASFAFGNWWPFPVVKSMPTSQVIDSFSGGVLTLGRAMNMPPTQLIDSWHFLFVWLAVLAVTAVANLYFLWRAARERRDFFVSPGMKAAARALLPSYTVAAFATVWCMQTKNPSFVVPVWIVCHGLGLLATAHFAPRSLVRLGWAFLLAGLASFCVMEWASLSVELNLFELGGSEVGRKQIRDLTHNHLLLTAQLWMAATFGLFHVIYAICTWPRKTKAEA